MLSENLSFECGTDFLAGPLRDPIQLVCNSCTCIMRGFYGTRRWACTLNMRVVYVEMTYIFYTINHGNEMPIYIRCECVG
jgi:hypothetical protein